MEVDGKIQHERRKISTQVISYGQKDYATAAEFFKRAIKASPGSPSEADFADFMKSEAKRGLAKAQEKL